MKLSKEKLDLFAGCQNLMIIPFYKNVNLVERQIEAIIRLQPEIEQLNFGIIFINDSPDVENHKLALRNGTKLLKENGIKVEYVENGVNLGFVKSANVGLNFAVELKSNALLVNSDAFIEPGSLTVMHDILTSDEKVGFVGPRSNDASIASIPWDLDKDFETIAVDELAKLAQIATSKLPRYQIVPVIPGSVMWIKSKVLKDVGVFDEIYSPGYNEENDLTMRANQIGYISVLANHAFAHHLKSISFGSDSHGLETRNSQILEHRYPYYFSTIQSYIQDIDRLYERLLVHFALNSERPTLLVDLTYLRTDKTGTSQVSLAMLRAMFDSVQWNESFKVTIFIEREVEEYHELKYLRQKYDFINSKTLKDKVFCARLYMSQPFNIHDDIRGSKIAAVNLYYFFDNIANDCYYLRILHPMIDSYWRFLAKRSVGLIFLTEYSRLNFYFRFDRESREYDFVAIPSFDLNDYMTKSDLTEAEAPVSEIKTENQIASNNLQVLIIGNKFFHKRTGIATEMLLNSFKDIQIVELGSKSELRQNLTSYPSGRLTEGEVASFYRNADLVVFPTNYEGFGFPLLNSLALNKHIVVFDLEVFNELITYLSQFSSTKSFVNNVHKLSNFDELIEFVADFRKGHNSTGSSSGMIGSNTSEDKTWGWNNTLNVVHRALITSLDNKQLEENLKEDLFALNLWESSLKKKEPVDYTSIGYRAVRYVYRRFPAKLRRFLKKLYKK